MFFWLRIIFGGVGIIFFRGDGCCCTFEASTQTNMKTLYTFLLLLICRIAFAQNGNISGKILDQKQQPLIGASVLLLRLPDSTRVNGQATDENGAYLFSKINSGKYVVKTAMVGFATTYTKAFDFTGTNLNLPILVLNEQKNTLKEVTVSSTLPQLEQKADRLVVNVEKLNTAGDNALDVMKKAPGIRLDKDDNILFHGNGGVNVMIDGKMTYMSSLELSNYLKTLPANTVSKIELMSNPPASFDAAGTAGVINIILKRNKLQGFNGTVTALAGYGKYEKAYAGLNLNYNTGKLSFFTRISDGYYNSFNRLTINRKVENEQYNLVNYWHPKTKVADATVGADYFISKKHTVGVLLKGYSSPDNTVATSNSAVFNGADQQISSVEMVNPQTNKYHKYNANLNYKFNIDTIGQSLNIDADYITSKGGRNENFSNNYYLANGASAGNPILQRNTNAIGYDIYAIKADYVKPLSKTLRAEAGWKSSWVSTASNGQFDSLKIAGWIRDLRRSNDFRYQENINAAYFTMSKTLGKLDLKVGLRAEQTNSTVNSITTGDVVKRSYWQLFPTAFASYKLGEDHQFNASFSRRISRPSYSSLNPFIAYSDPYSARQGNPYLQPSLSQSIGFSYTYKSFQVLSLNYLRATAVINPIIYQNDQTKVSTTIDENLGSTNSLSASSAGSFNIIKKWWNVDASVEAAYNKIQTQVQGSDYSSARFGWSVNANQNFILPNNYKIQFSGDYSSRNVQGLFKTLPSYQLDLGGSKTLWNKNATISLKWHDMFNISRFRAVMQYNNVNTTWQNQWESRRITLSFTYKFGNMKIKTARDRKTGAGSEEGRM
ncbi:MAG: TonB-dependent receptor domain-containing protein [Janthinobacterium lividum]